jgi:hypothetical protein
LCVVTSSGVTIWLTRRRDKGRPAPTWERIWTATVWGQPVALLLAAVVPLLWRSDSAASIGWAAGCASAYTVATLYRNDRALAFTLRLVTAVLLAALAVAHGLVWSGRMADGTGWIMDAILVGGAALVAAPLRKKAPAVDL